MIEIIGTLRHDAAGAALDIDHDNRQAIPLEMDGYEFDPSELRDIAKMFERAAELIEEQE